MSSRVLEPGRLAERSGAALQVGPGLAGRWEVVGLVAVAVQLCGRAALGGLRATADSASTWATTWKA